LNQELAGNEAMSISFCCCILNQV